MGLDLSSVFWDNLNCLREVLHPQWRIQRLGLLLQASNSEKHSHYAVGLNILGPNPPTPAWFRITISGWEVWRLGYNQEHGLLTLNTRLYYLLSFPDLTNSSTVVLEGKKLTPTFWATIQYHTDVNVSTDKLWCSIFNPGQWRHCTILFCKVPLMW